MLVSDFDFDLPESLIAQEPSARRDHSRLLVVDRQNAAFTDSIFQELPALLRPDDLLVVNNTRVFPARLIGRRIRESARGQPIVGRRVEIFLVREIEPLLWETLVHPGKALLKGATVEFARGKLKAEVIEWLDGGRRIVRFNTTEDFNDLIDRIGRTPLPPYIKRDEEDRLDAERYQTVFASRRGAVAAPTAGLHFTPELLEEIKIRGIEVVEITLHVGYGTFQPVRSEQVEDHHVAPEAYIVDDESARRISRANREGRRIIGVGTTTTRALESAALQPTRDKPVLNSPLNRQSAQETTPAKKELLSGGSGMTDLFIYPGFNFRVVSGLVTNFHLPRSSLLMLVAAFAGRELLLEAYRHAVKHEYRFYSYGDAMLVL
jgi:S-adenosylmethionine:tRNA ribosyltransferase-isomerase